MPKPAKIDVVYSGRDERHGGLTELMVEIDAEVGPPSPEDFAWVRAALGQARGPGASARRPVHPASPARAPEVHG